jgi:hypothetical protein
MTHQEATYVNLVILLVLVILSGAVITMILWLICLVREMRSEIRDQITESVRLARTGSQDEIRALRAKGSEGYLVHTDDGGP